MRWPRRKSRLRPPPRLANRWSNSTSQRKSNSRIFVDYVSTRLGVKILYDEQIANKKVTIKAPGQIPADSLMGLLESVLKMKGMAPGRWRCPRLETDSPHDATSRKSLNRAATSPLETFGSSTAVTQVYELKFVDPERIGQLIKPFLTQPGANTITVNDQKLLIVTDYADNLVKISKLVDVIDRAGPATSLEFYTVAARGGRHARAANFAGTHFAKHWQSGGRRPRSARTNARINCLLSARPNRFSRRSNWLGHSMYRSASKPKSIRFATSTRPASTSSCKNFSIRSR